MGARERPTRVKTATAVAGAAALAALAALSAGGGKSPSRAAAPVASEPVWRLVYEHEVGGNVDLYVAEPGRLPRRLTDHAAVDCHARWMPDGRRIVFTSGRSGKAQLWEVPAQGGAPSRLRRNEADESQPDPSPDGLRLAFISDVFGADSLVMTEQPSGAVVELVRHRDRSIFGNPHWSPDGRQITFSSSWPDGHQIYVVDVASRAATPLGGRRTPGCEPRFSPDGRSVSFVDRGNQSPTSRLVELDLASGGQRVLVDWPALNYDLAYSPDGAEIAFASNVTGEWVVYRQRLSDGRAWPVSSGGGPARYPDYRPQR